ncbi:MAG TPA: ATP-binding cassette domain-containing protein [Phycisphaerae bacterium]|nr:ATP-binding cassette domain-containing protein [Phycisphaerae bacterium]HRW52769.1 ATP-binding cassette domain-containing protein [Phycisphaerae bacterium]
MAETIDSRAPAFELVGVTKRYDGKPALNDINLRIESGATSVLIGPSGCGKSTLIRLLVGLVRPESGVVRFEGRPLREDALLARRQRMGYVIQDGGLFPHLTAFENTALLARFLKKPADWIQARVDQLADLTHFPRDGLTRFPLQLSGGQRQRVSLMRALMLDPHVLLLDEPLGALDPMIRADLQRDLKEIFTSLNKTVVLVTHDLGEAAYLADEIVLLKEGRIVQRGGVRDLYHHPSEAFVSEFIQAQRSPLEDLQ